MRLLSLTGPLGWLTDVACVLAVWCGTKGKCCSWFGSRLLLGVSAGTCECYRQHAMLP